MDNRVTRLSLMVAAVVVLVLTFLWSMQGMSPRTFDTRTNGVPAPTETR
jgi:hypothetical protein